jgi:hypothetical protein
MSREPASRGRPGSPADAIDVGADDRIGIGGIGIGGIGIGGIGIGRRGGGAIPPGDRSGLEGGMGGMAVLGSGVGAGGGISGRRTDGRDARDG